MKRLEDYTPVEIEKFNKMHKVLKEYNKYLNTPNEIPIPIYSCKDMTSYSGYRELVITKECED